MLTVRRACWCFALGSPGVEERGGGLTGVLLLPATATALRLLVVYLESRPVTLFGNCTVVNISLGGVLWGLQGEKGGEYVYSTATNVCRCFALTCVFVGIAYCASVLGLKCYYHFLRVARDIAALAMLPEIGVV